MAVLHRRSEHDVDLREPPGPVDADHGVADERVSSSTHEVGSAALRALAVVAAAVPVVIGLVALVRIDWVDGLDSPAAEVIGLSFTPMVAIVTLVAGLVALVAAASPDRTSKLVVGAVLACGGVALLAISDADRTDHEVERAFGWLALFVGAVLLLVAMLLPGSRSIRRRVSTDPR